MTTAREPDIHVAGLLARLSLVSIAAAGVLVAIGYWPTRTIGGEHAVSGMLIGVGLALLVALIGLVPGVLTLRLKPQQRLGGVLTGMLIRFILMLVLLVFALLSRPDCKVALGLWAAIGYLVLLAVDTAGVAWLMRRTARISL